MLRATEFNVPISWKIVDYGFVVKKDGQIVRREWSGHVLNIPSSKKISSVEVRDRWNERPSDAPFWTKAFTDVIFGGKDSAAKRTTGDSVIMVAAPQVRKGETLAVTGSGAKFDDWKRFVPMSRKGVMWKVTLDSKEVSEYKFVIIDSKTGDPIAWETGRNRRFSGYVEDGSLLVVREAEPVFARAPWRGTGVAIPVFSLRSKGSFGVGDFGDLRLMVDWVARTHQRLLQVLPINDTTSTHTWTDSYPYSCISVFALHPQYADLRQLPELKDEKLKKQFEALREELNALPQIDYERVNNAKRDYLRAIFEQEGQQVLRSEAFKTFFHETEQWLVPYAQYCLLRDQTGTVDFSQWKGHETWDEADRKALSNPRTKAYKEVAFYYYVQFVLKTQMQDVHDHARQQGVILKGDIPIGVSRVGCDVWMEPKYFNMNGQAGAPPDDFAEDGQNWGFPTYNWDEMLRDNCAWWVRRFQNMSHFFDAYRIDHVLGFFRIWEIPMPHASGLMGQFSPALGRSLEEINSWGVHSHIDSLFLVDHKELSAWEREAFQRLYDDYFYRRNNQFWYREAMKKLPRLVQATRMLVCAEDLGQFYDLLKRNTLGISPLAPQHGLLFRC